MRFIDRIETAKHFEGKSVAIVGSGPGCLENEQGFVDSHDVVVRVNNFKCSEPTGFRTDVHYSFFGASINKSPSELSNGGVKLCMCKCPNTKFMDSEWHRLNNKPHGVDFRYIYERRKGWWFGEVYVPELQEFLDSFDLLNRHIPSTGFSALLAILSMEPKSLYLTGFDFFSSRIHNVNEPWRPGNPEDPIGHAPELERAWLKDNMARVTLDAKLTEIMKG